MISQLLTDNFNPFMYIEPLKDAAYTKKMWTAYQARLDMLPMNAKKVALYAVGVFVLLSSIATLIADGIVKFLNLTIGLRFNRLEKDFHIEKKEIVEWKIKPFKLCHSTSRSTNIKITPVITKTVTVLALVAIARIAYFGIEAYAPNVLSDVKDYFSSTFSL